MREMWVLVAALALCASVSGCANKAFTVGQASYSRCEGTATYDFKAEFWTCVGVAIEQNGGPVSLPFANIVGDTLGSARRIGLGMIGVPSPPPGATARPPGVLYRAMPEDAP